jgi:hypothetical protein
MSYSINEYRDGKFFGTIAGCGRNKGTWDILHNSKRTAQRHARDMRKMHPDRIYKVEEE